MISVMASRRTDKTRSSVMGHNCDLISCSFSQAKQSVMDQRLRDRGLLFE